MIKPISVQSLRRVNFVRDRMHQSVCLLRVQICSAEVSALSWVGHSLGWADPAHRSFREAAPVKCSL